MNIINVWILLEPLIIVKLITSLPSLSPFLPPSLPPSIQAWTYIEWYHSTVGCSKQKDAQWGKSSHWESSCKHILSPHFSPPPFVHLSPSSPPTDKEPSHPSVHHLHCCETVSVWSTQALCYSQARGQVTCESHFAISHTTSSKKCHFTLLSFFFLLSSLSTFLTLLILHPSSIFCLPPFHPPSLHFSPSDLHFSLPPPSLP